MTDQSSSSSPAQDSPRFAVLPLRDIVVFPHMVVPLFVGREKSIRALESVMADDKRVLLLTQKNAEVDDPEPDDIYPDGTIAKVLQLLKLPDGTVRVLVEGESRARAADIENAEPFLKARAARVRDTVEKDDTRALITQAKADFADYAKLNRKIAEEVVETISTIKAPGKLTDTIAVHLGVEIDKKQSLLAEFNVTKRLRSIVKLMSDEAGALKMEKRIRSRVKRQMEKTQREYYLNEQMKAIQKELTGEERVPTDEFAELQERIDSIKLSKEAKEKTEAELKKLRNMPPTSAEANVVRNYIDWMLSVPWGKKKRGQKDLAKAQAILDADHYGLDKVKERIIEHLAVQARTKKIKGPILCLVGPPGVGKTSLGRSVARAMGRDFVRVSLGGVRDESEIRGHRRTYIGSMPGRIVQSMKKAKTVNPLFLLDEIDKMGRDFRGDPAAALLEVLDPEQNSTFNDHYLDVDYDLSDVMFITTANSLDMPQPLLDRMEIITIPGYTEDEKVEIARTHLIPDAIKDHGLKTDEIDIQESALRAIIRYYTREAGVRSLKREIAKLCRKAVKTIVAGEGETLTVTDENIANFLGVEKFRFGEIDDEDQVGIVRGLAWTSVGGDILTIEAVKMPGRGAMTVTGNLKDVMKESISAARSYIQSRAPDLGISPKAFRTTDIHVHVPEGATPKDGPSAGIAMTTAMVSVLTGIPIRRDIAMTGEITLRGRVLPIGGLKEKLLAALRGGIRTVLIPVDNAKDLAEVPDNVKQGLEIVPVSTIGEVLERALVELPDRVEWTDADAAELSGALLNIPAGPGASSPTAH